MSTAVKITTVDFFFLFETRMIMYSVHWGRKQILCPVCFFCLALGDFKEFARLLTGCGLIHCPNLTAYSVCLSEQKAEIMKHPQSRVISVTALGFTGYGGWHRWDVIQLSHQTALNAGYGAVVVTKSTTVCFFTCLLMKHRAGHQMGFLVSYLEACSLNSYCKTMAVSD